MRKFEVRRHPNGEIALWDSGGNLIDGFMVPDRGQDPVSVVATAYTDKGQKFFVKAPVTRELLKREFASVEMRLKTFAEHWERGMIEQDA